LKSLTAIRVLSDTRPGHENQGIGLAEALARRTGARVEVVRFAADAALWKRCRLAAGPGELLIAAGHRTHLPLWWATRRTGARSVVIMKPTLPARLFDLCIIPRHDLRDAAGSQPDNLLVTLGALNRLPEVMPPKSALGLVLVGGPSAHHGWNAADITTAVAEVVAARSDLKWVVADSRRTPPDTLDQLRAAGIHAEFSPHQKTTPGWLPAQLAAAREVWVTEDSVSMLHEAVTAEARVGVLPVPRLRPGSRVARAVEELIAAGHASTLETWRQQRQTLPPPKPLHETARCADWILTRFFPERPTPA